MKDPKVELQTAYFDLLDGNVDVGGVIPVHDGIPPKDEASYPLIAIGNYTQTPDLDKYSFGEELTVTLSVIGRFKNSDISRNRLFNISNEVKQIIAARPVAFTISSFYVHTATLDNQNTFKELTDTHLYVYETIRFRHIIEQKQPA